MLAMAIYDCTNIRSRPSAAGLAPDAGTTWAELAVDFFLATRVALKSPGQPELGELAEQVKIFAYTAKRVADMAGGSPTPCASWKKAREEQLVEKEQRLS